MEYFGVLVGLCIFYPAVSGNDALDYADPAPVLNKKQFAAEVAAGSIPDMMGNRHYSYPNHYKHFGRRFVPAYPYKDKEEVLSALDEAVQREVEKDANKDQPEIIPIRASPEVVLEVARQARAEAVKKSSPYKGVTTKPVLRNGDYWNGVWKEDVESPSILRTGGKGSKHSPETIQASIMPGSPLYNLVTDLKKMSPKLLYIINKND